MGVRRGDKLENFDWLFPHFLNINWVTINKIIIYENNILEHLPPPVRGVRNFCMALWEPTEKPKNENSNYVLIMVKMCDI